MNNTERDAAIDDLIRRVEALEAAVNQAGTAPVPATTEGTDVRNEENSQPGQ